jgi:hypothetical protein
VSFYYPSVGDRVEVICGRWCGRVGIIVRMSIVQSGQLRVYPIVQLDAHGRAAAREVRVTDGSLAREEVPSA